MNDLLFYQQSSGLVVSHVTGPHAGWPELPDGMGCWSCCSPDEWERAVAVSDGRLVLADAPVRRHPSRAAADRADILQRHGHHRANRREAYDPLPEQIDRITKALAHLQAQGIDIGAAGREQVAHCASIKQSYPPQPSPDHQHGDDVLIVAGSVPNGGL